MGKHNGKARTSGQKVGAALMNRSKAGPQNSSRPRTTDHRFMYTSDEKAPAPNLNSVLENSDLGDLMAMAELAGRDFTAQRGDTVVVSTGATPSAVEQQRNAAQRQQAEDRNRHRLKLPRRPPWTAQMSADAVDAQERKAFVAWRRELASLEEQEHLVLTPFEKNLEVWRQLWRVLERSHIVAQVIDARDPLRYRSKDLEACASELSPPKPSLLLLNKADLLDRHLRAAWADYFDDQGVDYVFWSAKAAADAAAAQSQLRPLPAKQSEPEEDRIRVLGVSELLHVLEVKAEAAAQAAHVAETAGPSDSASALDAAPRLVVGLTGYPNVGKSSTINALFGAKKTAVAATPGKTKHFQTLNVTPALTLCDCPGLVLPTYAASKADMVAAGVIPIDRLTNVRAPVHVITQRVPRAQWERIYGLRLTPSDPHDAPDRQPTAAEVLRGVAAAHGWVVQAALPDEARAGRLILRDFTAGKLLHCQWPPGHEQAVRLEQALLTVSSQDLDGTQPAGASSDAETKGSDDDFAPDLAQDGQRSATVATDAAGSETAQPSGRYNPYDAISKRSDADQQPQSGAARQQELVLDDADLDLMNSMNISGHGPKQRRAEHKFHKKPPRSKGRQSQGSLPGEDAQLDGGSLSVGRRGGLVRVGSST